MEIEGSDNSANITVNASAKKLHKGLLTKFKEAFGFGKQSSLVESMHELIREHKDDANIDTEEREMLENMLCFRDVRVNEIMVPRTDIIGISSKATYHEVQALIISDGHTRFPVYNEHLDEIIGFVHVKDLISYTDKHEQFEIGKILRKLIYIPRSMKVLDLLKKMRSTATHMAIVLDEYGGTDGLVTIEDVFEVIIGDIKDEHDANDEQPKHIVEQKDGTFIIDGRAKIEDVENTLNICLSNDDREYETFSGFIMSHLGYIPKVGEIIYYSDIVDIKIYDADEKRIKSALITLKLSKEC